jgi:hypothetical protein
MRTWERQPQLQTDGRLTPQVTIRELGMQKPNTAIPSAECTAQETVLWIHEDGHALPYKHVVDGACECPTCESRITHIILPHAA